MNSRFICITIYVEHGYGVFVSQLILNLQPRISKTFPSTLNRDLKLFVNYMKATGADHILYKQQLVHNSYHHMFPQVCYDLTSSEHSKGLSLL